MHKVVFCQGVIESRRESLNQIYISFLRPNLEYASVVWDNGAIAEKDSLEQIQHEVARIHNS